MRGIISKADEKVHSQIAKAQAAVRGRLSRKNATTRDGDSTPLRTHSLRPNFSANLVSITFHLGVLIREKLDKGAKSKPRPQNLKESGGNRKTHIG